MNESDKGYQPRRFRSDADKENTVKVPSANVEETVSVNTAAGAAEGEETVSTENPETKVSEPVASDPASETAFDYVIPSESYKEHHKHRHRHRHRTPEEITAAAEKDEKAMEGYVFVDSGSRHHHRRHRRRRMKRWKKVLLIIVSVILAIIIALVGAFFVFHELGRRSMHNYDDVAVEIPTEDESGNDIIAVDKTGRVITYNGMSYALNEDLISLTFIGADDGSEQEEGLRMSDAIYIAAIDTKKGTVKILGVSRDTMAYVDVYSGDGKYVDTEKQQIAYSYAYGNDVVSGGENTNAALSRLFFGLPMKDYFAINMDALTTLNDAIGGVTLTSSITFISPEDGRTISEGETVTLHGAEAERYVRTRDSEQLDSNNSRMQRQQEYIRGFMNSIVPAAKKDLSVITNLYSAVTENSDSSLNLPKITYIASTALSKLSSASDIEYINLTGEITAGEFAEMNITTEEALTKMLDVFYTPLAKVPEI